MSLDIPDLGDREYAAYVEAARSRIPVYTESWTDHNVHDPGITILETFAWLAETYVYQLDRFDERHLRKYLELLGSPPNPPRAASVQLRLSPPAGTTVDLPGGTSVAAGTDRRTALSFETVSLDSIASVSIVDARIDRVVTDYSGGRTDNGVANETDGTRFLAFGPDAETGSALYLGFEGNPFPTTETGDAPPERITVGVQFDETGLPAPATHGDEPSMFEPSVELAWEYCVDYDRWYARDAWAPLPPLFDGTNCLYESGILVFERPAVETAAIDAGADGETESAERGRSQPWPVGPGLIFDDENARYWIRCRVTADGYEIPPRLSAVAVNVVPARHRATAIGETLERVDGRTETTAHPGQTFAFEHTPVLEADVVVVSDPTNPTELTDPTNVWNQVSDLDASGPEDQVFVLDEPSGTVTFGDEVTGAVPTAGRSVVATRYIHGGGRVGNVTRTVPWQFVADAFADLEIIPFSDATGGSDAETVEDALARVRRDMKTPYRAVTLDDYQAVAMSTPGLRFGRAQARVIPSPDANTGPSCEDRGLVQVVVVPYSSRPRPCPSPGFLDAVHCHLLEHALLTDRVQVVPPSYVGIGVTAVVRLEHAAAASERTMAVTAALDSYLDPLSGFAGDGWPFGRPVYRSELYEVIEAVDGIDCVLELLVTARGAGRVTTDGDVELGTTGLPYSLSHDVVVEADRDQCGEEF